MGGDQGRIAMERPGHCGNIRAIWEAAGGGRREFWSGEGGVEKKKLAGKKYYLRKSGRCVPVGVGGG